MPWARVQVVLVVVATTVVTFFALAGQSRFAGPVLLQLSDTHGVHRDDLLIVGCWGVVLVCCWRAWR